MFTMSIPRISQSQQYFTPVINVPTIARAAPELRPILINVLFFMGKV